MSAPVASGQKVHIVTYGCYSSAYTAGVFTDKDEADRYAKLDRDGDVQEHVLNEMKGAALYELFRATLDRGGNETSGSVGPFRAVTCGPNKSVSVNDGQWFVGESETKEKALKLAGEARQSWLREHQAMASAGRQEK